MAKEILKATDLFKIKGSYIIGGTKIETGVNEYSNNPQCFAMERPAQSATAAAKITAVIRLFGRMNEISFYEAENSPLVMIESHGNFIQACLKSDRTIGIRSTFDCVKKDLWVAVAALAMAKSVRNLVSPSELGNTFANLVRTMTGGATSSPENTKLLSNLFCDIIYYYMIKDSQIELESGSLTIEEVKTAYNTGLLTTHSMFDLVPDSVKLQAEPSLQKEKTKTKKSSNGKEFLKNAKAGKFQISYDWSDEQKMHIQPASFLDTFVSSRQFESLTKKIKHRLDKVLERQAEGVQYMDVIGNDYINALMVGKTGTGKTTLAYALSAATGLPVYTTAISHNTDETEFSGITTIVDGKPQFCSTNFLDAYKNGGIIVLEEVNLANPSVLMGGLGQAIEYPFIIKENGYKDVRRHPLCVVIGTMNVGTAGSKPLNAAFANRFRQTYTLNDPTRDSLIEVLEAGTSLSKKACTWVYDVYTNIIALLSDPDTDCECDRNDVIAGLSLRTCMGTLENMEEGDDCFDAVDDTMIGSIARQDLALAREISTTIRNSVRPLKI